MKRLKTLISTALLLTSLTFAENSAPHFASGVKVGEVDQDSALVWVRLTKNEKADFSLLPIFTEGLSMDVKDKSGTEMPTEVVPGLKGQARIIYHVKDHSQKIESPWATIHSNRNFTHQFQLKNLHSNSTYLYTIEAKTNNSKASRSIKGSFKTAPSKNDPSEIRFVVTTCQAIRSVDSGPEGHVVYKNMLNFKPNFFVHTGDILYYDKSPLCVNKEQAESKWDLMFGYQHNKNFHLNVTSYFMKDDHDTLKNDCWPGQTYHDLTFDQGLKIFKENVPMGDKTYRTFRWGKDVQIWLTENRDYRSPNNMKDGPDKTILGKEQKAWLKSTIQSSDAKYKFIITPGPIVGPDKKGKKDNHANAVFYHEGQELRNFIRDQENTYVICGDRHWQYLSVDPKTKILEMGCGPINDQHGFGGNSGEIKEFHKYFSGLGGFLGITVKNGKAKAQWFSAVELDPKTNIPKVRYTEKL